MPRSPKVYHFFLSVYIGSPCAPTPIKSKDIVNLQMMQKAKVRADDSTSTIVCIRFLFVP